MVKFAEFEGEGAHTGEYARIRVFDHYDWIIFEKDGKLFPLDINKVETRWATIFAHNGFVVFTIEHLLAAIYGLSLRGARITLEQGREIPLLDGSSLDFVSILARTIEKLDEEEKHWHIKEPIEINTEEGFIRATPSDKFEISYTIEFDHPLIGKQTFEYTYSEDSFVEELAPARTFVPLSAIEKLRKQGLAQKKDPDGVIVLTPTGLYDGIKLRFRDEFVRHKVLDLIGDLSFLQFKPMVSIEAYRAGHRLHIALAREIMTRGELR